MSTAHLGNPLDLRAWIEHMRELGEIDDVSGADAQLEIGAISQLNVKRAGSRALLFDDIPGYPAGWRVMSCSTSSPRRLSSILRLGDESSHQALVQKLRGKPAQWLAAAKDFAPVTVSRGPVLENIQRGEQVNVQAFPAPLWNEKDGGRFIGTGCSVVTRDLESGWINVGTYRVQVAGPDRVTLMMIPGKHGHIQHAKYIEAGKPFPVAIVLGADPLNYLISGIEVPFEVSEFNYIGAILGQPVSVVHGEVTGLPFPSGAEIVLEGFCHPGEAAAEGPFGEFLGYYAGGVGQAPVVRIERIYHRHQPIIMGSPPGKPPNDYSYSKAVMRSAILFNALVQAGVPEVQGVWAHEVGGARLMNVVSIRQRYAGHARQAGHLLSQCGAGAYMSKYSIVVDEDIDPANLSEVMWALATRTEPSEDFDIIRRGMGSKTDPMSIAYPHAAPLASKVVIDACKPFEHLARFPQVVEPSRALRDRVRDKWPALQLP